MSGAGILAVSTIRRIPSPLDALSDDDDEVDVSVPAAGVAAGAGAEHPATNARIVASFVTMHNAFKDLIFIAEY
jgi:hypothetical protein